MFTVRTRSLWSIDNILYIKLDKHAVNAPVLFISRRVLSFPSLQTKIISLLNLVANQTDPLLDVFPFFSPAPVMLKKY